MKAAVAWSVQVADLILERNEGFAGLEMSALNPFLDFMKKLREREHEHRSLVILRECGSPQKMLQNMTNASRPCAQDRIIGPELCDRLLAFAERFEGRGSPRWPHEKIEGLHSQVMGILANLGIRTKAEMYHSGPWPTEKMSADEVIPAQPRIQSRPPSTAENNTCATCEELKKLKAVNATARQRDSLDSGSATSPSSFSFMAWFSFAVFPFYATMGFLMEVSNNFFFAFGSLVLFTWVIATSAEHFLQIQRRQ